jgi:prepilin-type processing-associated H-X9-DG protein
MQRGVSATYLDQQIRTYSVPAPFVFGTYSSLSVNFTGAFMRAPIPGGPSLSHTDPMPVGFRSFRLTELKPGSGVLLLVEQPNIQNILGHISNADCRTGTAQFAGITKPLHDGRYNYLFNDGHVEKLRVNETVGTGTLDAPRGMWTRVAGD